MGKLFRSWFKKKRKSEPNTPPTEKPQYGENEQLTHAKIHPDDEALTFTHGSLLDDVLSGLKDHDDDVNLKKGAPDSPLESSIRATLPDQRSQQKQINNRLSENNGSSIYQQSMAIQTPPCRVTPDSPSISPSTPSTVVASPGSAATPSTTANTKLVPSSLASHTSTSSSALLVQSISQPNNAALDQQNGMMVMTSVPLEPGTPNGHGTAIKKNQQQQRIAITMQQDQQQLDDHQDQHEQHSTTKAPSIVSSKVSHDSNQDKRNRYLQVTGVSMSRMKERHRQECRRSMQSNTNQLNASTPQQSDQLQTNQPAPHPSFQSSPLGQHQQQKKLNQLAQRHHLTSPSMPSLHPMEPKPFYSSHTQSQQTLGSTIPAGTSFPPVPPVGTIPPNSIVRSSSLMTDIYQSSAIPDNGITTPSPLPNDFMNQQHQWRQQPLFPYQSDIVLPPYNPSQLNTILPQQMPSSSLYRINTTNANHKQMFPRSASVYGGINQYQHHDIMHGGGFLLRPPMMDSTSQQNINTQQHRKSMPSTPRLYKPQLSLGNDQQSMKNSKRDIGDLNVDSAPGTDFPTSFTCEAPKNDIDTLTVLAESPAASSTDSIQQQSTRSSSPNDINQGTSSSNNDDVDVARSNSSCTIDPNSSASSSPQPSIKNDDSNGGLDEKLEIPSLVEHLPTKLQQQAELRIMKKQRQPHRRRRRFSLPSMPTSPSPSSSSSSISSVSSSKAKKDATAKKSATQIPQFAGRTTTTTNEASQKTETAPSIDCSRQQTNMDHHDMYHQQHHHHPAPVCSINGNNEPTSSHRGSWSANNYHSCVSPLALNPLCCPPSSTLPSQQHNCQQHPHLHYHHQQAQQFHHHSCGHPSSISLATTPIPPSCCTPPVVQTPPPAPCCSQSYHYRHHHHHSHHQRCQHRHSHHHGHQKQMKKSSSVMTKVDQDDTATIRSSTTKSVLGQKGRLQQQKKMIPPPTPTNDDDDDDDAHTISADPEKKPATSQSAQRPLFRSFLPRPPRFSTSIPRPPQQQQQQQKKQQKKQKVKVSASKSTYSWIPSRA